MNAKKIEEVVEEILPEPSGEFYPQSYVDGFDYARFLVKKLLRSGKLVVPMTVEEIETVLKQFEEHDDHTEQVFNFMLIKQQAKAIHAAQTGKTKGESNV